MDSVGDYSERGDRKEKTSGKERERDVDMNEWGGV